MIEGNKLAQPPADAVQRGIWRQVLVTTLVLYCVGLAILLLTSNVIIFPTVGLIGSFIVPVTYVAFFYTRRHLTCLTVPMTAVTFLYGGVLGVFASGLLEPLFVYTLSLSSSMIVGLVEEASKIGGVLLLTRKRRHYSQLEGLILGAAAGMGFASFESNGYAFFTFFQSGGSLTGMVAVTLLRGLLSPIGHGTWTAILGSVVFRERQERGFVLSRNVLATYILVSVLHALWNGVPFMVSALLGSGLDVLVAQVTLGVISILLLWRQWLQAISLPLSRIAPTCD